MLIRHPKEKPRQLQATLKELQMGLLESRVCSLADL